MLSMKKALLGSFYALFSFSLFSASDYSIKAIYGDDDRLDPASVSNSKHLKWYRSTAAMISKSKLELQESGNYRIKASLLGERTMWASGRMGKMCKDERFVNQPQASVCSGFLVGSKYLVTAGHCIRDQKDCDSYQWVFDYHADPNTGKVADLGAKSVYSCKKIIDRKLTSKTNLLSSLGKTVQSSQLTESGELVGPDDYALIELDRKVEGRKALKVRKKTGLQKYSKLVLIGYPSGLPAKISAGAEVKKIHETYFEANLDAFGGNSGSAVINEETGVVEGILVRGRTDYVYDLSAQCVRPAKFSDNDSSYESSTLITNVSEIQNLPQEKPPQRVRRCFLWWCWYKKVKGS